MTIRRARPEDATALSALAYRSKAHWGYSDAFMKACRAELTLSPEAVAQHPTFLGEEDGRVVGFCRLVPSGAGVELEHLYVDPEEIRRGHGRQLLEHARTEARLQGHEAIDVQSDPHAEAFYVACGAQRIGMRPSGSIPGRMLPVVRLATAPHA